MKPGLTLERHREVGLELKSVYSQLITLSVEVGTAYPKSGDKSRFHRALKKAVDALIEAKHYGEENLSLDYPNQWVTYDYSPLNDPEETEQLRQAQIKSAYRRKEKS